MIRGAAGRPGIMEEESIESLFLAWRDGGDLRALGAVFDEVAPELFAVARHLARGAGDAEDLVQDTFLAAVERAGRFDRERALRPWLFGMLAMGARKLRARRSRDESAHARTASAHTELDAAASKIDEPVDALARDELRAAVAQAVRALPPHYASVVALHLEDGLAPRDIAPRLSITIELARTHLSRGLERLRRSLPASVGTAWSGIDLTPVLASVRERVLTGAQGVHPSAAAPASSIPGAPSAARRVARFAPASSPAMLAAVVLVCASVVGALAVAAVRRARTDAQSAAIANVSTTSQAVAKEAARTENAVEIERGARLPTRTSAVAAPVAPSVSAAHIHGRLALPDQSPAAGTTVDVEAFVDAEWRMRAITSVTCAADGRFDVALSEVDGVRFHLRVARRGCAVARCIVGALTLGGDADVGEVVLPRGCTLRAKLVDARSRPLSDGWDIGTTADDPQARSPDKRWAFVDHAAVDARDGTCVLTVPAGDTRVVATNALCRDQQPSIKVAAVAGKETAVELSYSGPDLSRRLLVQARGVFAQSLAFAPPAESVTVRRASDERAQKCTPSSPGSYLFDDLDAGDYSIEIDDARFETWTEPRAQPGRVYTATLVGAASAKLSVRGADKQSIQRYGLTVVFPGASFRPNEFELRPKDSEAPADGRIEGLMPGSSELVVSPDRLVERRVRIDDLRRGETRAITVDYGQSASIEGHVVDREGRELAGVKIELTSGARAGTVPANDTTLTSVMSRGGAIETSVAITRTATSDAHGRFSFGNLERGTWTVRARFSRWLAADKTVKIDAEVPPEFDLVRPPGGALAGRIVLPEGVSASDVELFVDKDFVSVATSEPADLADEGEKAKSPRAVVIAADGSFRIGPMAPGSHVLRASIPAAERKDADGRGSRQTFSSIRDLGRFEIADGRDVEQTFDVRARLDDPSARVTISVRANGAPVSNVLVTAFGGASRPARRPMMIATDADGRATITIKGRERVQIAVVARELGWVWRSSDSFEGTTGKTTEQKLDVPLAKHAVQLVDARSRAPLATSEVRWSSALPGLSDLGFSAEGNGQSDARGRLELALPPGRYEFFRSARSAKSAVDWTADATEPVEIAVESGD
jgi:RNA polymerase sigma-70 factor (ECF subfamily)